MTHSLCSAVIECLRPDGTLMDLARPDMAEIDFAEIARRLSHIPRFNAATPGVHPYSVAQHLSLGTEAMLAEGEDPLLAALFLLQDTHEAFVGDLTRPTEALLAQVLADEFGAHMGQKLHETVQRIKAGWDEAIYASAGLPGPSAWRASQKSAVQSMDARMLAAEIKDLFPGDGRTGPQKRMTRPAFRGAITPWPAMKAEFAFLEAFERLIGMEVKQRSRLMHEANRAELCATARQRKNNP